MPVCYGLHAGIVFLALLHVVHAHRAALACLPVLVAYKYGPLSAGYAAEQRQVLAVVVVYSVYAYVSSVPAVPECDGYLVLAGCKQVCDVVDLILEPFSVVSGAGRQDEVPCPLSVDLCLVKAVACYIKQGRLLRRKDGIALIQGEASSQHACRLSFVLIEYAFRIYPPCAAESLQRSCLVVSHIVSLLYFCCGVSC